MLFIPKFILFFQIPFFSLVIFIYFTYFLDSVFSHYNFSGLCFNG